MRGRGHALSTRNFHALFAPRAIVLIGASDAPRSVGRVLSDNLHAGSFAGPVMTVGGAARSPAAASASVADLPVTPDLAVVAMPPASVPGLLAELGARGCRAAIVVGDGRRTAAPGPEMASIEPAMLAAARPHLLRLVGPDSLGVLSPAIGLNASLAPTAPAAGDLAFLTQSGAVMTAVLDRAAAHAIGLSHAVALGGMADVDVGDMLDFLATDRRTRAVLMHVEAVTDARKFMSAARAAGRLKPVVVVKAGRSAAGARAARSHTGALAGSDAVYEAAFRRAGLLRVGDLRELFEAAATLAGGLAGGTAITGDRLLVVTNGGGLGVLACDALETQGGRLAEPGPDTLAALAAAVPGPVGNPLNLGARAGAADYEAAVFAALSAPEADAVLVLNAPSALADGGEAADGVVAARARAPRRPALACWLGEASARAGRARLEAARVPTYGTPDAAVRAFQHLVAHRRHRALLMQVPEAAARASAAAIAEARATVGAAVATGRQVLTDAEAMAVLALFGIPTVATRIVAADPAAAAAEAARIGFPAVLKILSPDIAHKSEVGGVRLALMDGAAVEAAGRAMLATVAARAPAARVEGFVVQAMASRPRAHELVCGLSEDATFGPVVLFGAGGTAVELLDDHAVGLPPLDPTLARDMIGRTRVARLLAGYGDRPPADLEAVAAVLVALSELAVALPEVVELDINPLVADADGVLALDARIVVAPAAAGRRLAIRPYPRALERRVEIGGGESYEVRPIRPEDAPALAEMVRLSTPEDVRLRFFAPVIELSAERTARLTQIDYDREMALVAVDDGAAIVGVVRLIADPENDTAEFAVMVRSDIKGRGLGSFLMQAILDYARARGTARVVGTVLRENTSMLRLCTDLGFAIRPDPDDAGVVIVEHALRGGA